MKTQFGQKLKDLRIAKGVTLRQCSEELNADASNWSKLERGVNPAPKDGDVLEKWAAFFGITGDEKQTFFDLAALSRKEIPADMASDATILEALPVFFRARRGAELDDEKLAQFVAEVKKLHTPDSAEA